MVGLRQAWYNGNAHEHALAYTAPRIPKIINTQPSHEANDVPIDSKLLINYDSPVGEFIDTKLEISPDPGNIIINNNDTTQEIIFNDSLRQDVEYTVTIYHTPRSFVVNTNEDIERGDTEKIYTLTFRTVTAPLIESYEPKGESVRTDQNLKIVFDTQMDQQSVLDHLTINPPIEGQFEWEDERTLTLNQQQPLTKDTVYEVTLAKGIKNLAGGSTEEELKLTFKTIGKVGVTSISPFSGSSGIDPKNVTVAITFNQEVDHQSAHEHFSLSPEVSGEFSWKDNTLFFKPTQTLNYATKHAITITPGIKSVHGIDSTDQFEYAFTTKSQIFTLDIPWYRQEEDFTCNVAAVRMALAYRGVNLSEDSIQAALGTGENPNSNWVPGYGVHIDPVANYASQFRNVSVKTGWNLSDMLNEVQQGNPVVLWWYNRYSQPSGSFTLHGQYTGYRGMHSEVVRGFIGDPSNPTHILTNDPWRGQLTYTRATFESTWKYLNNTALIVY
jgi:uncharacterized protein YvpB